MPQAHAYVSSYWANGPPSASVDDKYWGFSRKAPVNLVPAGVILKSTNGVTCHRDCNPGSSSGAPIWRFDLVSNPADVRSGYSGDNLELRGDNGQSFPLGQVIRWSWAKRWFIWCPTKTNLVYTSDMLDKFNKKFPVGTTFTVQKICTNGLDSKGHSCGLLPKQPNDGLVFETGFFDVNLDPKTFQLRHFGRHKAGHSRRSLAETTAFLAQTTVPASPALKFVVVMPDGEYQVAGLDQYITPNGANFPVHVVKDGRFQSHVVMHGLRFEKNGVASKTIKSNFEIVVWPKCISFSAALSAPGNFSASLSIRLNGDGATREARFSGTRSTSLSVRYCASANTGQLEYVKPVRQAVESLQVQVMDQACNTQKIGKSSASPALPLVSFGSSPAKAMLPLSTCEGDCDTDGDCSSGLKCFQRNGKTGVPGCTAGGSGDLSDYDYCYKPNPSALPLVSFGSSPAKAMLPLSTCEGDCDTDGDCSSGLKCFQRNGKVSVPGCTAGGSGDRSDYDYCYKLASPAKKTGFWSVDGNGFWSNYGVVSFNSSLDQCKEQCRTDPGCVAMSFYKSAQDCYNYNAKGTWVSSGGSEAWSFNRASPA